MSEVEILVNSSSDLPGAIANSPDLKARRNRRPAKGWKKRVYDYLVVPAEVPSEFTEPLATLWAKISTGDVEVAANVLSEAQGVFDEASGRIESAERRATALQGTVAIAASLAIAGGALVIDSQKIPAIGWRIVLAALLGIFVGCLVGCAWRALAVTGRMFEFEQPGFERIPMRSQMTLGPARTLRAAELLRAAGVYSEVGAVKVGLLLNAAWWLRAAMAVLCGFIAALTIYVISDQGGVGPSKSQTVTTRIERTTIIRPAATAPAPASRKPPRHRP